MYQEFFVKSPLLALPVAALVIFVLVFAGIVVSTLRRRSEPFDSLSRLPMDDEREVDHG